MQFRGSGLLLHITSLATRFGIGDLGPAAYAFVDFICESGQQYWQILPVFPTDPSYDNSPYHDLSTFAGNILLISPEKMILDGYLEETDIHPIPDFPPHVVDFEKVIIYKNHLFSIAYNRFKERTDNHEYNRFCSDNSWWLDDYALFTVLRQTYAPDQWNAWPQEYKERNKEALELFKETHWHRINKEKFLQYVFFQQWISLRSWCRQKGVWIIGDIPIYVDYDSVDLWMHPELFRLDGEGNPLVISGVPPDFFSETGQVWDNPIYNWEAMEKTGFRWWVDRIRWMLSHVDHLRIDHFRGLVAYWEIPAGSDTAVHGEWTKAPVHNLLKVLTRSFPSLPVIAEDLGLITADVREVMHTFHLPGMKVLQFAFGTDMPLNPYIPHLHTRDCVVYTGTHDNNSVLGWFEDEATDLEKKHLSAYAGMPITSENVSDFFIRLALMSVANTVIIPIQDILNLGSSSRMNRPGIHEGNWRWRLDDNQLTADRAQFIHSLTRIYGRD